MTRKNANKIIESFKIFFSSIKTYFLYLDQCLKYLLFPVFGQIISTILIFTITFYFVTNFDKIKSINNFFNNDTNIFTIFAIILLPFMIILVKAFFDYIIAFASLNILFFTVSNKKKIKNIDFTANNNVIKRKLFQYILLLLLIILIIPPFIFIAPIFLCLSIQTFALEGEISAPKAISRSVELIKQNIIPTIIMLVLCCISTYWFLPNLFMWAIEKTSISSSIISLWEGFFALLPIDTINEFLSKFPFSMPIDALTTSESAFAFCVYAITIAFTLPLRCCCFTNLYKLYDSDKIKEISKESDEIIKRATTKKGKK